MPSFAEIVAGKGREFIGPPGTIFDMWTSRAREQISKSIEPGIKNGHPMELEFGLLEDMRFGAWASVARETDVIAINAGVLVTLVSAYRAMLSHADVFPHIGDPLKFNQLPFSFSEETIRFPLRADQWHIEPLLDPVREEQAHNLAQGSFYYIVHHELAHIYNGHVDYLNEAFGIQDLVELGSGSRESLSLTRQTLEWDADLAATQHVLLMAIGPVVTSVNGRHKWSLPQETAWGSLNESIVAATVVSSLVHCLFSDFDELRHPDVATRNHPPSMVRLDATLGQIVHVLWLRAGLAKEASRDIVLSGIKNLVRGLRSVFPRRSVGDEAAAADSLHLSGQLAADYEKEWARIVGDVEKFKRGGLLAPAIPDAVPL
ncbi:hypothetical protein U1737_13605 [Sphingomonas sp. LB3N6]|uniref:hypothetical protein n=1 Tax=Sphingomonas fucosidasi TaxID=3096164 RepID=UPI002FCB1A6E